MSLVSEIMQMFGSSNIRNQPSAPSAPFGNLNTDPLSRGGQPSTEETPLTTRLSASCRELSETDKKTHDSPARQSVLPHPPRRQTDPLSRQSSLTGRLTEPGQNMSVRESKVNQSERVSLLQHRKLLVRRIDTPQRLSPTTIPHPQPVLCPSSTFDPNQSREEASNKLMKASEPLPIPSNSYRHRKTRKKKSSLHMNHPRRTEKLLMKEKDYLAPSKISDETLSPFVLDPGSDVLDQQRDEIQNKELSFAALDITDMENHSPNQQITEEEEYKPSVLAPTSDDVISFETPEKNPLSIPELLSPPFHEDAWDGIESSNWEGFLPSQDSIYPDY